MIVLDGVAVRAALPMADVIEAMKRAFAALSAGQAEVPLRSQVPIAAHEATALFMPAYVAGEEEALAVKVVTLHPGNPARGLPFIHAAVLVFDAATGELRALLDGEVLTALRTGAGAGAATDLLARPDSRTVAIVGAGVQARTALAAVCAVRPIERVWVYGPTPAHVDTFITEMAGQGDVPPDLRRAQTPQEAIRAADIICTATTSATPVFDDGDVKPGAHINSVGSYTPQMAEVPAATVCRATVVVDSRASALAEAGDILQPLAQGRITADHIHAELGELVLQQRPGRTSTTEITFFKSVGVAVQDAVAAQLALARAATLALGQSVEW